MLKDLGSRDWFCRGMASFGLWMRILVSCENLYLIACRIRGYPNIDTRKLHSLLFTIRTSNEVHLLLENPMLNHEHWIFLWNRDTAGRADHGPW